MCFLYFPDAENDSEIELIEFPSFSKKDNLKKSLIKRSVSKAIIKNNSEKKVVTSFKKKRRIQFEKKTCKDDVPNLGRILVEIELEKCRVYVEMGSG